jgi:ankyrin repeat protein
MISFVFVVACCVCVLMASADEVANRELQQAVGRDDMAGLKAALGKGADINARGSGGQSPLMQAVLGGKINAVKYLLRKGADPTVAENDGYTPMHGAGFQGRAEIAEALIAHGLDARDLHEDGYEPIQRACWGGDARHTDTVRVFLGAGGVPLVDRVFEVCRDSQNEATRDLIKLHWTIENKQPKKMGHVELKDTVREKEL